MINVSMDTRREWKKKGLTNVGSGAQYLKKHGIVTAPDGVIVMASQLSIDTAIALQKLRDLVKEYHGDDLSGDDLSAEGDECVGGNKTSTTPSPFIVPDFDADFFGELGQAFIKQIKHLQADEELRVQLKRKLDDLGNPVEIAREKQRIFKQILENVKKL